MHVMSFATPVALTRQPQPASRHRHAPSKLAGWLPLALLLLASRADAADTSPAGFEGLARAVQQFKDTTDYPTGTAVIV